jgi:ADP-ribosylation factor-binding protein GGA
LEDLALSIRGSQPKLQKLVEDEADDTEAVSKLLELSQLITADLERYDKLHKGDFHGASQVVVNPLSEPITPTKKTTNGGVVPTSLIDFDGELVGSKTSSSGSTKGFNTGGNLLDDLAGLSFQSNPPSFGQGGSIALGQDTSMFSSSPSNTPGRVASPVFPTSPPNKPATPDYSAFASLHQSFSSYRPSSNSFSSPTPASSIPAQQTGHTPTASVDDDFGGFSSAVSTSLVQLTNSANIGITLEPGKAGGNISLTARFTNKLSVQVDEITFQMAVPRVQTPFSAPLFVVLWLEADY